MGRMVSPTPPRKAAELSLFIVNVWSVQSRGVRMKIKIETDCGIEMRQCPECGIDFWIQKANARMECYKCYMKAHPHSQASSDVPSPLKSGEVQS